MFNTIQSAIEDIKKGKMVIVVDDENRENEGDFVMAAQKITPKAINEMALYGRGLICTPMTKKRASQLKLNPMVDVNTADHQTAFTVSIDLIEGTSTGISAYDRSLTIKHLIQDHATASDFARPGHVFPLIANDQGVLGRQGHTEAAVDLSRMAGLGSMGVICEIMNPDGSMARVPQLINLAKELNLKLITIKDLVEYRKIHDIQITRSSDCALPTKFGQFQLIGYENLLNQSEHHLAFTKGIFHQNEEILVRVHSECLTGDIFKSNRCDCGEQLEKSLEMIQENEKGVLIYLRQEGRGIGLINKIKAYHLQENGHDTVDANIKLGFKSDHRDYHVAAQILKDLGINKVKLITNNPAKIKDLEVSGLEVVQRIPLETTPNIDNHHYLHTKKNKMGHILVKNLRGL